MLKWTTAGVIAVLAFPVMALAAPDCEAPKQPDLPKNGALLSSAQLDEAANKVSAYSKATQAFQQCLDVVITTPEKHPREEWRAALKAYNAAAPSVEQVWDEYQKLSDDWVAANLIKAKAANQ